MRSERLPDQFYPTIKFNAWFSGFFPGFFRLPAVAAIKNPRVVEEQRRQGFGRPEAVARARSASGATAANRVLLINAGEAFGRCVELTAKSVGFNVARADNLEALAPAARQWRPTVIVLGICSDPNNDGAALHTLASAQCPAHIVLTGDADRQVFESAMRSGRECGLTMSGVVPQSTRIQSLRDMLSAFKKLTTDTLKNDLAATIAADELFLEYQPKFDCTRGLFTGVEALVRWCHPVHGLVDPAALVAIAEEANLIRALTDRVAALAVRQAAEWHAEDLSLDVAINISPRDAEDVDLPDRLRERCDNAGVDPGQIILELNETAAMQDRSAQMMAGLTRLQINGFRLSLDDFGTGYSSLLQLQRMPFSEIKIDQSFVSYMQRDESCRVIAQIILDLARQLGLKTVAEGVGDEETLTGLAGMGCDMAQGYHLSQPIAARDVLPFIRERNSWPPLQRAS